VDTYYGETTGSGTYHLGELVEISATPAEGFHFVRWDDDPDENSLVRRFYLDRYTSRFYEAIMESDATYHIRAVCEPEEAGTVTGCVEAAHYEDSVELDVTPAPGWRIVEWSDDRHFDGDHRDIGGPCLIWIVFLLTYGTGEHTDTTGCITDTNAITIKI